MVWGVDEPDWLHQYLTPGYEAAYKEAIEILQQRGGPWGRQFTCNVAGHEIVVRYFRAKAFRCYAALFTRNNVAPKVVCLKSRGQGRFLDLDNWHAPLGRAVADSPQPELLVTGIARRDDWPWKREWRTYPEWQAVAYWRQHPVTWPMLPPTD